MAEVSIIVPVYNVEKYLHRCVDSILQQTFKDFELILVDDGSPDNCGKICDEYAAKDSRVTVIHKANGGVSSARNAGLDVATGKYIMFCDSDDVVKPLWCEVMLYSSLGKPSVFVCCNVERFNIDSDFKGDCIENISEINVVETDFFNIYRKGISAYCVNKIYERSIIDSYGLRFDDSCSFGEDAIFNAEYAKHCSSFIYIDAKLYVYIQYPNSLGHRYYSNRFAMHLPIFMCRVPLIEKEMLGEYCDIWLYQFLGLFNNIFDKKSSLSLAKCFAYNQRMINSEEFKFCLVNATGKK